MTEISKKGWLVAVLFDLLVVLAGVSTVAADGAQITVGELHTFAAGLDRGYHISGQVQMVRTASGRTLTSVQAWDLAASMTYPAHVHNAPCAVNNGGGHYQHVIGGPADDVNEIWPGFTTNASGHGNGHAANDFTARPEAQSVVIHDSDGARIACADLE
jgi:hypothetical protein